MMVCRTAGLASLAILTAFTARGQTRILWTDPGNIAALDFGGSVGTPVKPPQPPFTYEREDLGGTQPKIFVKDAGGVTWNVKFGYEVKNESFCWRVVRACGYFAEPSFFLASGHVEGYKPMSRATPSMKPDGHFTDARFQYRDPNLKFLPNQNWRWDRGPYAGTKELSGLKILIMLFSNWDNKDGRVGAGGPNTAVFSLGKQRIYAFTDWGSGMGRWGSLAERTNWRCEDFSGQTQGFVQGVRHGRVVFSWEGDINAGFKEAIPPSHVAWLILYLGSISDAQLTAGLRAAGAADQEAACFTTALRSRIEQLRGVSTAQAPKKSLPYRAILSTRRVISN